MLHQFTLLDGLTMRKSRDKSPSKNQRKTPPTAGFSGWIILTFLLTCVLCAISLGGVDTLTQFIDTIIGPALDSASSMLIDPVIAFIVANITVGNALVMAVASYIVYRTNFCYIKTFATCVRILWKWVVWKRTGETQVILMIEDSTDLDNFWAILLFVHLFKGTEMFLLLSFRPTNFRYPSWTGSNFGILESIMEFIKAPLGQTDDEMDTQLQGFADVVRLQTMLEEKGLGSSIRIYYDPHRPAEPSVMRHEVHKLSAFLCAYVEFITDTLSFTKTTGTADIYWTIINYVNGFIQTREVVIDNETKKIYDPDYETEDLKKGRQERGRTACSQIIANWKEKHPERILCEPLDRLYKDLKDSVKNRNAVIWVLLLGPLDGFVRLMEYDAEGLIAGAIYWIFAQLFATDNNKPGSKNLFPNQYNVQLAPKATQQFMKLLSTFWFYRLFGCFVTCSTEVFKTTQMMDMFTRMSKLDADKIHPLMRSTRQDWLTWNKVANRGNPSPVFDPLPVLLLYAQKTGVSLFPEWKQVPMYVTVINKGRELVFVMAPSHLPSWLNKVLQICFGYTPVYSVVPDSVNTESYMECLTGSNQILFPKENEPPVAPTTLVRAHLR